MGVYEDKLKTIENFEMLLKDLKNQIMKDCSEDKLSGLINNVNSIKVVPGVRADSMTVKTGMVSDGKAFYNSFENVSALAIAGQPGSGKSNFMNVLMSAFVDTKNVEVGLVSGGSDYKWASTVVDDFINLDGSIDSLYDVENYLISLTDEMMDRFNSIKDKTGKSNFWDLTAVERESFDLNYIIVFVDALDDILFVHNSGVSREEKKVRESIDNILSNLIKKCRSVGITFVVSANKFNETCRSKTFNNIDFKVAFKMNSDYNVNNFFGVNVYGDVSPVNIPAGQSGIAVFKSDNNDFSYARIDYLSEEWLDRFVKSL